MDFALDDEQAALRTAVRTLLARESSPALVRARYTDPAADAGELWRLIADAGWLGLLVPESSGGLGLSCVELALVCEQAGYALAPVPLWETAGLAGSLLVGRDPVAGADRWPSAPSPADTAGDGPAGRGYLARLAAGARATAALVDAPRAVHARRDGDRWLLTGAKVTVPEAEQAELLAVTAAADRGPAVFVTDRPADVRRHAGLDPTRVLCDVGFADTPAVLVTGWAAGPLGGPADPGPLACATVSLAAELVGVARRLLDMTVAHVRTRRQFGVPVGSFQAVQHKAADLLLAVERAAAAVYWAAMCVAAADPGAPRATAVAKATAGDAARQAARDAVQLHGGIGYTWEHDLHLHLRRVYGSEPLLGGAEEQRARLAALAGPDPVRSTRGKPADRTGPAG